VKGYKVFPTQWCPLKEKFVLGSPFYPTPTGWKRVIRRKDMGVGRSLSTKKLDTDPSHSCGEGIHFVKTLYNVWQFVRDYRFCECRVYEIEATGVVVDPVEAIFGIEGKARTDKLKLVRVVPEVEWDRKHPLYGRPR
jgi:hypothetical protein